MKSTQVSQLRKVEQAPQAMDPFSAILSPLLDAKFAEFKADIEEIVAARPVQKLFDNGELAQWAGVAPETVRKMRADGMPFLRVGETYRYELDKVREWLATRGRE